MTTSRRRGLFRLAALLVAIAVLAAGLSLALAGGGSGGGKAGTTIQATGAGGPPRVPPAQLKLSVHKLTQALPQPVSGEGVLADGSGLLVIGGLNSADTSTSGISRFVPATGKITAVGSLAQPLHDLAAARAGKHILIFGGGSATTIDQVGELMPDGTERPVGRLPQSRSDLSAVSAGGAAFVIGGYDGTTTVGPVLRTTDGAKFSTVTDLPIPVRYGAVAASGGKIYVIGGELADGTDSDAIQVIDPSKGSAAVVGHLPHGLSHSSVVTPGGRVYLLGGRLEGSTTDQILRFDPKTLRAEPGGRLPEPVQNAAGGTIGSVGYLFGGLTPQGSTLPSIVEATLAPAKS